MKIINENLFTSILKEVDGSNTFDLVSFSDALSKVFDIGSVEDIVDYLVFEKKICSDACLKALPASIINNMIVEINGIIGE